MTYHASCATFITYDRVCPSTYKLIMQQEAIERSLDLSRTSNKKIAAHFAARDMYQNTENTTHMKNQRKILIEEI